MRGEVEIWNGDELIHKESNLLVNGAGEAIADMLTVSPSLSGIPSASALLDTSNYTIQAISFGKDASAYHENAHKYYSRRNLAFDSTFSSIGEGGRTVSNESKPYLVSSTPWITPPRGYEDIPSSIAHVTIIADQAIDQNQTFSQALNFGAGGSRARQDLVPSGLQDKWVCWSYYVKAPGNNPHNPFYNEGSYASYWARSEFKTTTTAPGAYAQDYNVGRGRNSIAIFWDPYSNPDYYTLSAAYVNSFERDQRGGDASGGFLESGWAANAGIEDAGDGWYRLWNSVPAPSAADHCTMNIYPAGWDGTEPIEGETSGGLFVYGFQCELGRWPTPLQFNSGYIANAWDLSGNVLSRVSGKYGYVAQPEDKGTVRVVPPLGTSSYVPTNYLSSPPNPDSTRVEDGDTFASGLSDALSGVNIGQNLNFVPYRSYGASSASTRQGAWTAYGDFKSKDGITFSAYVPNYAWPIPGQPVSYNKENYRRYPADKSLAISGLGTLGNQAFYLGCYPEGSSTGGSRFAFVSSLDNSAAFPINYAPSSDPNFVSGTYNSIVNEASSMDVFGFVGKVYDPKNTVGVIADVNKLGWTDPETIENTPGITFNSDLNGAFWGEDNVGTFSAIAATNPIGGPSSFHFSGAADSTVGYCLLKGLDGASRFNDWTATGTQIASVYFKRPGNSTVAPSSVMIKIKDNTSTIANYTNYFEYLSDGLVPTLKNQNAYCTTHIEDAGNDWYRIIMRVDGLADTSKTNEGDNSQYQIYLGDSIANDVTNVRGKYMLFWGPQFEQYPLSLGLSAQPFQNVAGDTPTIAEQNGVGGLNVSGGIDTTNSGTVEYSITIGSGDVGYSNLYGGIYNMGLWTIDTEESRLAGNMAPYSFGPLDNPRKYKLFATKHLTKNLGFIEDSGLDPGCLNYSDLTIKWRIHFT